MHIIYNLVSQALGGTIDCSSTPGNGVTIAINIPTGPNDHYETEYRVNSPDGAVRLIHENGELSRNSAGEPHRFLGTVQDITLQRRTEQELRLAATTFETREGILITDRHGTILRTNHAFTDITGYPAQEVVGRSAQMLLSDKNDAAVDGVIREALNKDDCWHGEIWTRRRDGTIFPNWLNITAVRGGKEEVTHHVGMFLDMTEVKRQQASIGYPWPL